MGAVPLAAALSAVSHIDGASIAAFFVRKEAKGHGTQSLIEGLSPSESLSGAEVVVLEDVTTTGGSALKAVTLLQQAGAEVAGVLTVVDRQEGADATFANAGLPFVSLLTADAFK